MADQSPYGIFLNYRRDDSAPYARLLREELTKRLPDTRVFMDVESIEPGQNFALVIQQAVESSVVLITLIGPRWSTIEGRDGRRLDDPFDLVRREIATALQAGVRVLPVLVEGASPPQEAELPAELVELARLNALELSNSRYDYDLRQLLTAVERAFMPERPAIDAGTPRRIGAAEVARFEHPSRRDLLGTKNVNALSFSPDGRLLASASDDKSVRVWSVPGGELRRVLPHAAGVTDVEFSPAGGGLLATRSPYEVQLWDAGSGQLQRTLGSGRLPDSVTFSPDGRLLASRMGSAALVWEVSSGELLHDILIGPTGTIGDVVGALAFGPDGETLAAGSRSIVRMWSLPDDRPLHTFVKNDNTESRGLAFSPDGRRLALAAGVRVGLWELPAGELRSTQGVTLGCAVAFSPDARYLAAANCTGRQVRLWDMATDDLREALHLDHRNNTNAVAFSPDGEFLAVGTGANQVVLWRLVSVEG